MFLAVNRTMESVLKDTRAYHRTIWLSDMHLGTRGCNANKILDFLNKNNANTIYLVGDIIDGWRLSRKFFWPQNHNDIIECLLQKLRTGTRIIYICGNHDEFLRPFIGNNIGGVELMDEFVHKTADGKSFVIIHGDKFDAVTQYHKWIALLGDMSYDSLIVLNRFLMDFRHWLGLRHWSLSAFIKRRVKQATCFISQYENTIVKECHQNGYDGIICGHIHHATIKTIGDIIYCNTGDWVESCTALVEDFSGTLSIIDWHQLYPDEKRKTITFANLFTSL